MDFNSGSFPLDFISFYLDMASEEQITDTTLPTSESSGVTREADNAPKDPVVISRSDSNQSASSGNTEESLTTYAEKTLRTLASEDPSLDISFLPAPARPEDGTAGPTNVSQPMCLEREGEESSQFGELLPGTSKEIDSHIGLQVKSKDYFATDTSEVEELFDDMGTEGTHKRPTSSVTYSELLSAPEGVTDQDKDEVKSGTAKPGIREAKLPD